MLYQARGAVKPGYKRPYPKPASSTDPGTWCTHQEALDLCVRYPEYIDGIGYVFAEDDPYCGIDADKCRDKTTGEITSREAAEAIEHFDTYTEASVSGGGVHMIIEGRMPPTDAGKGGRRNGLFELYDKARYFTFSGRVVGTPKPIAERQAQLDAFMAEKFPKKKKTLTKAARVLSQRLSASDQEVIDRAMRSDKFRRLWAGDTSGYGGDDSRADAALCSLLAFYLLSAPDAARIDALFRQSGLMRPKWEDRDDYRAATLTLALSRTDFYDPDYRKPSSPAPGHSTGDSRPPILQLPAPTLRQMAGNHAKGRGAIHCVQNGHLAAAEAAGLRTVERPAPAHLDDFAAAVDEYLLVRHEELIFIAEPEEHRQIRELAQAAANRLHHNVGFLPIRVAFNAWLKDGRDEQPEPIYPGPDPEARRERENHPRDRVPSPSEFVSFGSDSSVSEACEEAISSAPKPCHHCVLMRHKADRPRHRAMFVSCWRWACPNCSKMLKACWSEHVRLVLLAEGGPIWRVRRPMSAWKSYYSQICRRNGKYLKVNLLGGEFLLVTNCEVFKADRMVGWHAVAEVQGEIAKLPLCKRPISTSHTWKLPPNKDRTGEWERISNMAAARPKVVREIVEEEHGLKVTGSAPRREGKVFYVMEFRADDPDGAAWDEDRVKRLHSTLLLNTMDRIGERPRRRDDETREAS
jgi:hypothetical protein